MMTNVQNDQNTILPGMRCLQVNTIVCRSGASTAYLLALLSPPPPPTLPAHCAHLSSLLSACSLALLPLSPSSVSLSSSPHPSAQPPPPPPAPPPLLPSLPCPCPSFLPPFLHMPTLLHPCRWHAGTTAGQDLNLSMDRLLSSRNFTNKMWNAGKFILFNLEQLDEEEWSGLAQADFSSPGALGQLPLAEQWVISALHQVSQSPPLQIFDPLCKHIQSPLQVFKFLEHFLAPE